jgi:hypothetical protein
MKYIVSKWNSLQLIDYEKVLFTDVDILPIHDKFYEIFDFQTPSFLMYASKMNYISINQPNQLKKLFSPNTNLSNINYSTISKNLQYSLNGGLVLLHPDINLYNDYLQFLKICGKDKGYVSAYYAGPDETTLFLFYVLYKKIQFYIIDLQYSIVPWESQNLIIEKKTIGSLNFLSRIKSWLKHPLLQWEDERIWYNIGTQIFKKHPVLTYLFHYYIFDSLWDFTNEYNIYKKEKNQRYNFEFIDNSYTKQLFSLFQKKLKHKKMTEFTIEEMIEFNQYVYLFVHYLDTSKLIDFSTPYLKNK